MENTQDEVVELFEKLSTEAQEVIIALVEALLSKQ